MGMGFRLGLRIPWESHGNGNKTQNWEWEWEGMGNHLSGNGNYLHSHGNLLPKFLCCDELTKLYYTCQMSMPIVPSLPTTEMYFILPRVLCMVNNTKCTICLTLKSEAEPEYERF